MWLNTRRVVAFVFVERNEYFSFTFYTKMSALLLKASPFSPSVLALAKTNTKQSSLRSQRKQSSSDVVVVSASAGVGQGTSLPFRFLLSREYDYDFCSVIHSRENQLISLQCNRNPDDNDLTSLSFSLACNSNKRWIRNGHPQIRHLNRGGVLIRRRGHLVYQIWTRRAVRQTRCEIR